MISLQAIKEIILKIESNPYYKLLTFIIGIFCLFILYLEISGWWCRDYSGFRSSVFIKEFPIYLMLCLIFYFPKLRILKAVLIASIFPLIAYICFDLYYYFFRRLPTLSDFENLPYLFLIDYKINLFIFLAVSLLIFLIIKQKLFNLGLRLIIFFLFLYILIIPPLYYKNIQIYFYKHKHHSEASEPGVNGRINSFIFHSQKERKIKKDLIYYKKMHIDLSSEIYPDKIKKRRNIYFIVLESFIDPRLIKNVNFKIDPLYSGLLKYIKNFHILKSPTYGGLTAKSEFEILTGLPSLGKVEKVEFNLYRTYIKNNFSFVFSLKNSGYKTYAFIATTKKFYNSQNAYFSLGFDNFIFLPEEIDAFKGLTRLEDSKVSYYVIKFIDKNINFSDNSNFIYILGMYGHIPFESNRDEGPNVIQHDDPGIEKIANLFYYRTKNLANLISEIYKRDKEPIIFVTADHLPAIFNDKLQYYYDLYSVSGFLLDGNRQINVQGKHLYEIPWIVWDILSENKKQRNINNLEKFYLYYLSHYF